MTTFITGVPALALGIGIIVLCALPVWLAAKITDAEAATLPRSIFALLLGSIGSGISTALFGGMVFLLGPLCFLLSFKIILKTSMLGALLLGILALIGYAALAHFVGGIGALGHGSTPPPTP